MNPYAEAIGQLFSGKSLRPVIIWIVQNNPATFCKAFRACYPEPAETPKFDAVITKAENDAKILAIARISKFNGLKEYRKLYPSSLIEAKEAVEKMLTEDVVKS